MTDLGETGQRPGDRVPPGMKLELGMSANATDEDLQLALQTGPGVRPGHRPGRRRPRAQGGSAGDVPPRLRVPRPGARAVRRRRAAHLQLGQLAQRLDHPGPPRPRRGDRRLLRACCAPSPGWASPAPPTPTGASSPSCSARRRSPSAAAPGGGVRRRQGRRRPRPPALRPGILRGRDLGQLRLLRRAGRAGGRGRRRARRHAPGRPAPASHRRRTPLHLQLLRRLRAGPGHRGQPQRGRLPVHRLLAGGRRADGGHAAGGGRRLRPARQALPRPLPQRERAPARTSSRPTSTRGTWTCTP